MSDYTEELEHVKALLAEPDPGEEIIVSEYFMRTLLKHLQNADDLAASKQGGEA